MLNSSISGSGNADDGPHLLSKEEIKRLEEAVLIKRPVLREIIEKRGHKDLFKYAEEYADVNFNEVVIARQNEVFSTFKKVVAKNLGEAVAQSAAKQLKKYYFVSTADHHGPICHSFFLNSNLVNSICGLSQAPNEFNYVIALSCANVSFSNSSFPRGLLFHSYANGRLKTQQLGLFPNSSRIRLSRVFAHPAYDECAFNRVEQRLKELENSKEISPSLSQKLNAIIREIYFSEDALKADNYSDQITKTNFLLWRKMFEAMKIKGPDLLYIELEAVVSSLLIDHHLNSATTLNRILFSPEHTKSFIKHFNNIEGGFSLEKGWGTCFFWALPKGAKYSKKLRHEDGFLINEDKSYKIELKPEEIRRGLEAKEIFPGTQLSLLVLSLYYGIKCLGGFCQVNYLTDMKQAYANVLNEMDMDQDSLKVTEDVQTKELGEDLTIAFLEATDQATDLAAGLDLILYGDERTWPILLEKTKKITVAEALSMMMPDFYHIMYAEAARDPSLVKIKAGDIMKCNGLSKKIKACVKIKE